MDALDKALEGLLPGEGWRFLQDGEVKREGDEWKYGFDSRAEWRPVICPGEVYRDIGLTIVRRRGACWATLGGVRSTMPPCA